MASDRGGRHSDRHSETNSGKEIESRASEAPVHVVPRRRMLGASAAVGLGLGLTGFGVEAAKSPERMRPQAGDLIVFRFGDKAGQAVRPDDVPTGSELLQVIAKDPASGVVRDGTRLNGVNLVRVNPSSMSADARAAAADDVLAFSSVCTHQGCDLTQWWSEKSEFECYCHHSKFDASKDGEPVHGPAKRRLAMLPIKVNGNGFFEVTGKFTGSVGFK